MGREKGKKGGRKKKPQKGQKTREREKRRKKKTPERTKDNHTTSKTNSHTNTEYCIHTDTHTIVLPEFVEVIHVIKVCVLIAKMWHSLLVGPPEQRKTIVSIWEVSTRQLSPVHKIGVSETAVTSS